MQVGALFQADALERELLAGCVAQQDAFEDGLHDVVAAVRYRDGDAECLADLLVLAEQHVQDDPVDAVVCPVEHDGADGAGALPEPVDAALALLVPGRVPRQVVVDDGLEVLLQVHAFGQAVGRHQHRAAGIVGGQFPDPGFPLVGRQHAGDRADGVIGAEAPGQVVGDVFGGVDEPAEHHRVESLEQQLGDRLVQQRQLGVGLAFQLGGPGGKAAQPPAVRRVALFGVAVGSGGGVGGLDGLLVGQVEYGGAAEPVGLCLVVRVEVGRSGAQGGGGRAGRGGQRAQQRQRRPVPDPLPQLSPGRVPDGFAGVLQDVVEELLIGR